MQLLQDLSDLSRDVKPNKPISATQKEKDDRVKEDFIRKSALKGLVTTNDNGRFANLH
jgi:hypothetical protein